MELGPFIRKVHEQLDAAAALGDERTREIAAALSASADAAVRIAILNALSEATGELTDALASGEGNRPVAVTMHLEGEAVRFQVNAPPVEREEPPTPRPDDGDASARISLRLPEGLKSEIEKAAGRAEVSVNSWLVRAASHALRHDSDDSGAGWQARHGGRSANRVTGWVTG
jgi:hypothetical protein